LSPFFFLISPFAFFGSFNGAVVGSFLLDIFALCSVLPLSSFFLPETLYIPLVFFFFLKNWPPPLVWGHPDYPLLSSTPPSVGILFPGIRRSPVPLRTSTLSLCLDPFMQDPLSLDFFWKQTLVPCVWHFWFYSRVFLPSPLDWVFWVRTPGGILGLFLFASEPGVCASIHRLQVFFLFRR